MQPFFSVIIPLYNKEAYIEATLKSVLEQSFKDFEIIVVNDGSTDGSVNIVKQIDSDKITLFSNENKGLSATRNFGIEKANGQVVALLDADDLWHKDYLKKIHLLYNTFPEASLYGTDYLELYNNNRLLAPKKNIDKSLKDTFFIVNNFFKANNFQPIISPSSFAFKKAIYKTVKFDTTVDFAEDIMFYIESNLKYKLAYLYKAMVHIRYEIPNQITKIGLYGKRLPNFDKFCEINELSLKQYIDTYKYYFLIDCRLTNDIENFNALITHLNLKNLTSKQRFLLNCPLFILRILKKIKAIMLKANIRLTSY